MKKYKCFYGLGGGFGGARYFKMAEFETEEEANDYAWEKACEYYTQYEGLYGIRDYDQIATEEKLDLEKDEEEIEEIYYEDRERWLDYWVEEVK